MLWACPLQLKESTFTGSRTKQWNPTLSNFIQHFYRFNSDAGIRMISNINFYLITFRHNLSSEVRNKLMAGNATRRHWRASFLASSYRKPAKCLLFKWIFREPFPLEILQWQCVESDECYRMLVFGNRTLSRIATCNSQLVIWSFKALNLRLAKARITNFENAFHWNHFNDSTIIVSIQHHL